MPKKTTILIILLAIVTAILVFFAISANNPSPSSQSPSQNGQEEQAIEKTSNIYFNPNSVDMTTSTSSATIAVDIMVDTGENSISGVQAELQYDPTAITNIRLEPALGNENLFGTSATVLLNEITPTTGRISYATAIGIGQPQAQGNGKIATLYFDNAFGNQNTTTITFLNKTHITILGSNESVLNQKTPLTITLSNQTNQPIIQDQPIFETLPEEPLVP